MAPKVSVSLITYNQKEFLRECLDSIISQDYPNFEIIVADDASTDGSRDMLQDYELRYPDLIKLILAETNGGITVNSNLAYFACDGEYIAWMAGDDMMLPGRISKQVEVLERDKSLSICCSEAEVFDSITGKTLHIHPSKYKGRKVYDSRGIIEAGTWFMPSGSMSRRSMCPAVGFDSRLPVVSDFLFFAETSMSGQIYAIDEPLVRYRIHPNQTTSTTTMERPDPWLSLEILEFKYPHITPSTHRARAVFNFQRGFILLKAGKVEQARRFFLTSLHYRKSVNTLFWLFFTLCPQGFQEWATSVKAWYRTRKANSA